jgi:DNA-binding response OmpR family regulator
MATAKILIVEDDPNLLATLKYNLLKKAMVWLWPLMVLRLLG